MTVDFYDFIRAAEQTKRDKGIIDSPEATDAMRNKGERRTPAKRELLRRMRNRATASGREPIIAYF